MEAHESDVPCAVAVTYGLHPRAASKLPGGYVNESWKVECEEGDFVVRRYGRLHVTRRALLVEHAIMKHAAQRLEEVRAPLRAPNGSTLHARDGRFVGVQPYISGETGARDARARCGAARLLARFHRAMERKRGAPKSSSRDDLGRLRERLIGFARDPLVGEKLDWDVAIAAVEDAAARLAQLAPHLPKGIVHGDVQPANFVHRDGRVVGLIDFDFAQEGERAYDVAVGIDEFAANDFADAYAEEHPLAAAEREVLPAMAIRRNAWMIWYIVTQHGERVPGDVGNAARYLDRLREIQRCRIS